MTTRRFEVAKDPDVDALYSAMADADLQPLWLLDGLMTERPTRGRPHRWRGSDLRRLGQLAGQLIPIEAGGDRRVLALCNPSLDGRPYATSTLWGAIQYLGPGEVAPAHRHSPAALRFVLEGEGVWTRVDGDAVPMGPGDLVLTPSWTWHEHHNASDRPMVWFDALDLPLVEALDAVFFEPGPVEAAGHARPTPASSGSELSYGAGPGLLVTGERPDAPCSPLLAYRWSDTEAGLGRLVEAHPGQPASLRYSDPTTGGDVMATLRCEVHRLPPGACLAPRRRVGSSLWVTFRGSAEARVAGTVLELREGDVLAVTSWAELAIGSLGGVDLFCVSDAPVVEALGLEASRRERPCDW